MSVQVIPTHFNKKKLNTGKVPYPQCRDGGESPRLFWLGIWCSPRGHGKTYSLVRLLKHYEDHGVYSYDGKTLLPQRIILFSPTFEANPIFRNLKWLDPERDVIHEYSDDALRAVIADIAAEKENTDRYLKQRELFDRFVKAKDADEFTDAEILELESMAFLPPVKPRYEAHPVNTIVFDDMLGSAALRNGRSPLINVAIRNRHIAGGLNIAILVQGMKQVPKVVRSNASLYVIGKFLNQEHILKDLYEEVSGAVKPEQFAQIYEYAISQPHGSLVIDMSQPREKRFSRNFEEFISIK